jgi:glycosyltransferase involved in cell wall biosynthesis
MAVSGLRTAMVAGTLGQAGAEKQLYYLAQSLRGRGVDVRVYALTEEEHFHRELENIGCAVVPFGQVGSPALRLARLVGLLKAYQPHVIHSAHFYTNLYAGLAGMALGVLSTGSSRGDPRWEVQVNGAWGRWLIRVTDAMIANSHNARERLIELGLKSENVFVLSNVIDLYPFDRQSIRPEEDLPGDVRVANVGRLTDVKRAERFIDAIGQARRQVPGLWGFLIGDGNLRQSLQDHAAAQGLLDNGIAFLGRRRDVPGLLHHMHIQALTSKFEGFPNVLLEGMAARLPVVTTPAGDAPRVVIDGQTGFVVPHDPIEPLVERLVQLARDPRLRAAMGAAGREVVETRYRPEGLAHGMLAIQRELAERHHQVQLLPLLEASLEPR